MSEIILPWFDKLDGRDYACVMWNLTRQCGFGCGYCPFHNDNSRFTTREEVVNILLWLTKNVPSRNKARYAQITLFGGEPTKHPEFLNILPNLSNLGFDQIPVYTNFSAGLNLYFNALMTREVMLIITYHEQHISPEKFIEKLSALMLGSFSARYVLDHVRVNVMTSDPRHLQVAEEARKRNFAVNLAEPHRHRPKDHKPNPTSTVVDTVGWNELVKTGNNCFTGWNCLAGKNNIYIEENGDLFPCQGLGQAVYVGKKGMPPRLANIFENPDFKWVDVPETVCPLKSCRFELFLTKYK